MEREVKTYVLKRSDDEAAPRKLSIDYAAALNSQQLAAVTAGEGPSLVIAYSHCIAHGINMAKGMTNQKMAVDTGYWPIFRYNPASAAKGENPFKLDCKAPKLPLREFTALETRFKMLEKSRPDRAKELAALAQEDVSVRWKVYEHLAASNGAPKTADTTTH